MPFTRFLLPFLALATGCAQGSSGALGQTDTTAACPPSELVCAVAGIDAPIAKGAALPIQVSVTSEGAATPPLSFVSANPAIFTIDDARIHAQAPGLASMLITTAGVGAQDAEGDPKPQASNSDLVVDFLHVWVAEADALRLHRVTTGGLQTSPLPAAMEMLVGDELTLVAAPHRGPQRLLGELDAAFEADPQVVLMLDEGVAGSRRIVATAPGETTVTVKALDIEVAVALTVLEVKP
ncbi:hypothetical protein [Polyangium sp. 15x6]|uniref:hypothetical protein n=1 Tax=Polyangium sp. 15x6 TaxID=3042687 RepID=UPI00249C420F|nr:hypothetical protein [Polyangium sp. 15x6]MDI3286120.1 hypothetical protein [Polyangium sp. 15x6]